MHQRDPLEEMSKLQTKVDAFRKDPSSNKQSRYEIRTALVALANSVEPPMERALRTLFERWPLMAALAVAIRAGWLHSMVEHATLSTQQLSEIHSADRTLIARIMRVICASGYANEIGPMTYEANEMTKVFATPGISDGYLHCCESVSIIFGKLSQFLETTQSKDPASYVNGPHTFTFHRPLWTRIGAEPHLTVQFNQFMKVVRNNREAFVDIFPFQRKSEEVSTTAEDVLFIDIAGGMGHRVQQFRTAYPDIAGRAMVQDLPHAVPSETLLPAAFKELQAHRIEAMSHDMLDPQPVYGARYYFFSAILHGWPDAECLASLRQTVPAMKGFSRILIYDWVIPEQNLDLFRSCVDMWMMTNPTGRERTRADCDVLLAKVGLKIVQVHVKGADSVIEVDVM